MTVKIQSKNHLEVEPTNKIIPKDLLISGNPPLLLCGMILPKSKNGANESVTEASNSLPKKCQRCGVNSGVREKELNCPVCTLEITLTKLTTAKKLSIPMWERFRQLLKLPNKTNQFPPDKARAVSALLYKLAKDFTLDQQSHLSETEILLWLSNNTGLPKVIAKSIRKQIKNHTQNSTSKTDEIKDYTAQTQTPKKRKAVSPQKFLEVAIRQGMYCFWCGIRVVRETQIPPLQRVKKSDGRILHFVGDELRDEAIATIDHLIRVKDGGTNEVANLVICCENCNLERDRITQNYGRPFANRRVPCSECGGRFFHPDWGCCSICGAVPVPNQNRPFRKNISRFFKNLWNLLILK